MTRRAAEKGEAGCRAGGRRLGQNFLVDRNILGVIERLADLSPEDVVLEIGGGEGVLSERLAGEVAHLHVVEVDRRLEEGLRDVLSGFENVTLWMVDALSLDLAALEPAPTAVVANLPYSIAATVILRTIDELASVVRRLGRRFGLRGAVGAGPAGLRGPGAASGGANGVPPGAARGLGARGLAPAAGCRCA